MRIKITHPDDLSARSELILGFLLSLAAIILWNVPVDDSVYLPTCVLTTLFGVYFLLHPLYLLRIKRAERRKDGPDVKALEFAAQGVSVYRPPLAPLFFPYKETSFSLEVIAVKKRNKHTYWYSVSAVYMTFRQKDAEICIPCGISRKRKQLRPLLDVRRRFASFSLTVEPFSEQAPQTLRRQQENAELLREIETMDDELRRELDMDSELQEITQMLKERQEPEEVSTIRRELEDYMKYGIWPALSGDMRSTYILFGLTWLAMGIYMAARSYTERIFLFWLLLLNLLYFAAPAFLLYIGIKDWLTVRKLQRLKSRDLDNLQRAAYEAEIKVKGE